MIAMPLACSHFQEAQVPEHPTAPPFQPLDACVLNASIPAFYIGRDKDGFWLARDTEGGVGGIFLLESSALAFARRHSRPGGCATIHVFERFELDVENQGNTLIVHLRPLMRLAMRGLRRITALRAE